MQLQQQPHTPLAKSLQARAKIVYISGKITGLPDLNKGKFKAAENHVRQVMSHIHEHVIIINPHDLPDNHDKSWASYMKECLKAICNCSQVFVLDDWMQSKGALTEVFVAKILDLKIYEVDSLEPVRISYHKLFFKLLIKL